MRGKVAVLLMEQPWFGPDEHPKRPSVYPFVRGIEKFLDFVNLYYTTFYEKTSFKLALERDLSLIREKRAILYIASHGGKGKIGNEDLPGIRVSTMVDIVTSVAKNTPIEGVIIGACEVGVRGEDLREMLRGTNITWLLAYTDSVDWFLGALIETSVLFNMVQLNKSDLEDRGKIFEQIFDAVKVFNPFEKFGDNKMLKDCFRLLIQQRVQGAHPIDYSEKLAESLVNYLDKNRETN